MVVQVRIGDLFQSNAQALVNTVNCVGVMGKGIALQFKERFPDMYKDYEQRCRRGEVKLGTPYLYRTLIPPWVVNFPTKDHWRSVSRIHDIIAGLECLLAHYKEWGITSLAVPPLGCGQGQLEWAIVGATLYSYLNRMDIPVELYAPYGTPQEQLCSEFLQRQPLTMSSVSSSTDSRCMNPAWIAIVAILDRIEQEPYHWPVGRTAFQKIVYVATTEGLPTGLQFEKGSFGPFSKELKKVHTKLVNNGLIREQRVGRMFAVSPGPTFEDAQRTYARQLQAWEPIIHKVSDLFMRIPTKEAEVVATVLFSAQVLAQTQQGVLAEMDILSEVMRWKQKRRPPLNENQVAYTIRNLAAHGWLNVAASSDLPLPQDELLDV